MIVELPTLDGAASGSEADAATSASHTAAAAAPAASGVASADGSATAAEPASVGVQLNEHGQRVVRCAGVLPNGSRCTRTRPADDADDLEGGAACLCAAHAHALALAAAAAAAGAPGTTADGGELGGSDGESGSDGETDSAALLPAGASRLGRPRRPQQRGGRRNKRAGGGAQQAAVCGVPASVAWALCCLAVLGCALLFVYALRRRRKLLLVASVGLVLLPCAALCYLLCDYACLRCGGLCMQQLVLLLAAAHHTRQAAASDTARAELRRRAAIKQRQERD